MPDTGRLVGYARVSTKPSKSRKKQHPENQVARLRDEGCETVFTDLVTGTRASRPEWDRCLAYLRPGDTLVATRLNRIGRSLVNLIDVMAGLQARGVGVRILDQRIDTATAEGRFFFHIMAALAQLESEWASERTLEGMEAARERHGGTLPVRGPSFTEDQKATARMLAGQGWPAGRIAKAVGVSRATLYRHQVLGPAAAA